MTTEYYKLTLIGELRERIAKASYEKLFQEIFHTTQWIAWDKMDSKMKKPHYKFAEHMIEIIKPYIHVE